MNYYPLPDDIDNSLWRFLDTTKFMALLTSNSLFFPNVQLFEDPFEGSLPHNEHLSDLDSWNEIIDEKSPLKMNDKDIAEWRLRMYKAELFSCYVSCWYWNPNESDAMWKLYSGQMGVAVQTTCRALLESFKEKTPLHYGLVTYIDYEKDSFTGFAKKTAGSAISALMHKRLAFQHEREFRIVEPSEENFLKIVNGKNQDPVISGIVKSIDLDILIKNVIVSPFAPKWFEYLIQSILNKYEINIKVSRSEMTGKPIF